jgi:hypothetical protein
MRTDEARAAAYQDSLRDSHQEIPAAAQGHRRRFSLH